MRISILTFDAFNDLDSLVAFGMLNRTALLGDTDWQVHIASPTPRVTSMNGLTIDAHEDLSQLAKADAVLIGSGMKTREVANTPALMEQLRALNPERQLLAAQCSGTFFAQPPGPAQRHARVHGPDQQTLGGGVGRGRGAARVHCPWQRGHGGWVPGVAVPGGVADCAPEGAGRRA